MEIKKSYYAVIPASVRYDKSLPMGARMLYGEITALCNQEGFCWANNQYFQDLYEVGKNTIVRWVNELINSGYIIKNIQYAVDGKTVLQRCLSLPDNTRGYQKRYECSIKNDTTPSIKNDTYNNTNINNTNNISKKVSGETFDSLIDTYTDCQEIKDSLIEFIKMRKLLKKPMTNKALELIFEKLDKLTNSNTDKVAILNQSICNSWQGVFELKQDNTAKQQGGSSVYDRIDNLE
ncbi:MAG: helix-turn-helix domain-containing protein [Clostridia bacterium]